MSEKKTSTPEQIPLHEVVLKVMYDVNKERPAHLTISEVYQKISDASISESSISDVLNWLVAQNQVEKTSGKYALDRYSFLEERAKDRGTHNKKKTKKEEETPLHEIILNLMFEASKGEPTKFTLDDVFWMVSDPKVQKSLVSDVLKWLLNQGRVEYLSGKYSLDRIEFQDQKKISEKKAAEKPKPKKKKAPEKKPKIVIPASTEEAKVEPKQPKKKEEPQKKEEPLKKVKPKAPPVEEKPKKVEEPKVKEPEVAVVPEPAPKKWRMPLLVLAVICVVYTFYLLFALNGSISSLDDNSSSGQVQVELISAKTKLNEISNKGTSSQDDINFLKERIQSLEELNQSNAEITPKDSMNARSRSLLTRLVVALCLTFILISFLLFGPRAKGVSSKT